MYVQNVAQQIKRLDIPDIDCIFVFVSYKKFVENYNETSTLSVYRRPPFVPVISKLLPLISTNIQALSVALADILKT